MSDDLFYGWMRAILIITALGAIGFVAFILAVSE